MRVLLAITMVAFFLSGCASQRPNCGSKAQKRAQHAKTKKMVGAGWLR